MGDPNDRPQMIFKADDYAPPRPKQWYDFVEDGVMAVTAEHGRYWHKNCPKDPHGHSGIMGIISKRGADGLARIKCHHCGKQAFIPRGYGNIRLNEVEPVEEHDHD